MPAYKITRVYKVEAATKAEALEKIKANPTELLEYEAAIAIQTERGGGGFVSALRKQVIGK